MGQEGPLLPGGTGQGPRGKGINIEEKNHITDYQQQTKLNFKVILGGLDLYLVIFFRVKSDFLYCRKQTKTKHYTQFHKTLEHLNTSAAENINLFAWWERAAGSRAQIRKKNILQSFSIFSKRERKPSTEIEPSQMPVRY